MAQEHILSAAYQTSKILASQSPSALWLFRHTVQIQTWLWVLDITKSLKDSLYFLTLLPTQKQNSIPICTNAPLLLLLEMFRSRSIWEKTKGRIYLELLVRGTGRILLLSLGFDKLVGSKHSCDQMTKHRSSLFLLIVEFHFGCLKDTQKTVSLWSTLLHWPMQLCASRGCCRWKCPILPALGPMPQGFQKWRVHGYLEVNYLSCILQISSFWDRASKR